MSRRTWRLREHGQAKRERTEAREFVEVIALSNHRNRFLKWLVQTMNAQAGLTLDQNEISLVELRAAIERHGVQAKSKHARSIKHTIKPGNIDLAGHDHEQPDEP